MTQNKVTSLAETATQVGVKFFTATALWCWLRPMAMDIAPYYMTLIFTVHSFALGYIIRRLWA